MEHGIKKSGPHICLRIKALQNFDPFARENIISLIESDVPTLKDHEQKPWFVYMIQSEKDKSIYTGIAIDVMKRLSDHNKNKGAKYTKGRGPFVILKSFLCESKSSAAKLEFKIKKLSREEKLKFTLKEI